MAKPSFGDHDVGGLTHTIVGDDSVGIDITLHEMAATLVGLPVDRINLFAVNGDAFGLNGGLGIAYGYDKSVIVSLTFGVGKYGTGELKVAPSGVSWRGVESGLDFSLGGSVDFAGNRFGVEGGYKYVDGDSTEAGGLYAEGNAFTLG